MLLFFLSSQAGSSTMQANIDAIWTLKIILIVLFAFAFITGILNLLLYFIIKHSPDLNLKFFIPKLAKAQKNVSFNLEDDLGRPLYFSRLIIFKNEKIYKTFYFAKDNFSIYLPKGEFQATVYKFGHIAGSTKNFLVDRNKIDFDLILKRTQEVRPLGSIARYSDVIMILNSLLSIASFVILFLNYFSLTLPLQIVLLVLGGFSAALTLQYFKLHKAVQLVNFKNQPLANKKVEFNNRLNEPIAKFTTDKKGLLHILISPGIYRITPEDHPHRSVRVNETELGHFKVKF